MWEYNYTPDPNELYHYGVLGMRWGVRRYQNKDGSLTNAGRRHYYGDASVARAHSKYQEAKANRKVAKGLKNNARRQAIIPTKKNRETYEKAKIKLQTAKDKEYRSEFDYKTKREAARIRAKNIEFKEKSKYRQKLEAQYKKLGLSNEDAQAAANRKIRAEKILAASAALTVAACAAYAYNKHRKNKIDGVIKAGEALQMIVFDNAGGNISVKSVEEMTDVDGMGRAYAKEMMKVYGEMEIDATFGARGLTVAGILGGAAAISRISDPSEDERLKKR